jgi:hypothetical protein
VSSGAALATGRFDQSAVAALFSQCLTADELTAMDGGLSVTFGGKPS